MGESCTLALNVDSLDDAAHLLRLLAVLEDGDGKDPRLHVEWAHMHAARRVMESLVIVTQLGRHELTDDEIDTMIDTAEGFIASLELSKAHA